MGTAGSALARPRSDRGRLPVGGSAAARFRSGRASRSGRLERSGFGLRAPGDELFFEHEFDPLPKVTGRKDPE
ncbi:hypothetical protein GCM10009872_23460 [Actinopolymorpha rutila]